MLPFFLLLRDWPISSNLEMRATRFLQTLHFLQTTQNAGLFEERVCRLLPAAKVAEEVSRVTCEPRLDVYEGPSPCLAQVGLVSDRQRALRHAVCTIIRNTGHGN
jgi:hypothetical protein